MRTAQPITLSDDDRASLHTCVQRGHAAARSQTRAHLLASAGLDRLAHHAETLVITGRSYRAQGLQREEDAGPPTPESGQKGGELPLLANA